MALAPGTRLGSYEIVGPLGAGGMGEVYRARDTRLGRSAAVKTLPPEFAADPERRQRFEREAKTLATLNHPHIAQIYGLEDVPASSTAPAMLALAMELVEGEDLAQRLARGAVPLDEVWPLAHQIAEGLEAAHEAGIVHRDLKPANIRVTPDGVVKVLDFGLAKPTGQGHGISDASNSATHSPTIVTSPAMTLQGAILGTAAYMAPEQAKGRPVDRRADIWAFGCVFYELLTGRRAFEGDDVSDILGAILKTEPDWARLPAATPARVRTLLTRCLAKDRTQRLQHIGDARLELDQALREPALVPSHNERITRGRAWALAAGGVAAVGLGALLGATITGAPAPVTEARAIQFDLPIQGRFALSPDGRYLAYTEAGAKGGVDVWLRDLSRAAAERLGESDLGNWLGWSPDGAGLYVSTTNGIRRFNVNTKASVLESTPSSVFFALGGMVVIEDGRMVVGGSRISAKPNLQAWTPDGATDFIPLDASVGENRQGYPARLGGGLLSYASARTDGSTFLCIRAVDAPRPRCAGPLNQSSAVFYHDGRIVFARDRSLLVRGFDLASARFTSDEQSLADDLALAGASVLLRLATSESGSMAMAVDAGGDHLEWMSPGHQPVVVSEQPVTTNLALSPDGRRALLTTQQSVVLVDLARGATGRLGPSFGDPIWAPDGEHFAHRTAAGIVRRSVDDPEEHVVLPASSLAYPEDWSADGRWIVAGLRDGPQQIGLLPMGGGEPLTFLPRTGSIVDPDEMHFSPDGRWLAFNGVSGGRDEVFVVPVPPTGQRWQVSRGGGMQARWHPSGRTLHYLEADGGMMSVEIRPGTAFSAGPPTRLFDVGFAPSRQFDDYRIGPDGRFLVKRPAPGKVRVIVNWPALVKKAPKN